jgi:hypothetical protein
MGKKKNYTISEEKLKDWAIDWEDPILQLKIIKEMQLESEKTKIPLSVIKNVVGQMVNKKKKEEANKRDSVKSLQKKEEQRLEKEKKEEEKTKKKEEQRLEEQKNKREKEEAKQKEMKEAEEAIKNKKNKKNIDEVKEILTEEQKEQEFAKFKKDEINWLNNKFYDTWDKVKGHWHNIVRPDTKQEIPVDESPKIEKWFFLSHENDRIEGKPQLVHDVMQRIPLIRLTSKMNSYSFKGIKIEWKTPKYLMFDQRYDKRYDGAMVDSFSLDFWVYKTKYNGKEYYIYSQKKLPDGKCSIKGMIVDMDDSCQMSDTLKINSLTHIFIAKEAESAIKTLPKQDLINFVKDKKINLDKWLTHLSQHPYGTINNFPVEMELLRSAFLLSGKFDGWPLHLAIWGPQGTRKTMGHGETLYSKFDEVMKMASATNYRLKGLIPSFRKSPPDAGYILQSHRIAIIDEIGKLIDAEANRHDQKATNIMGEFNDILEHKHRSGGSGNDFIDIDPTAKVLEISNPCSGKLSIYNHVGLIDPTKMGRMIWWIQDSAEQELVLGPQGLIRNPPEQETLENPPNTSLSLYEKLNNRNIEKNSIVLKKCRGELVSKEDFLTIYDSCNIFLSEAEDTEIEKLVNMVTSLAREPMKGVWRPRAFHHVRLLVDGICKARCLFDDKDNTFKAKRIDYDWAERILVRMVKSWDTDLSPKRDGF